MLKQGLKTAAFFVLAVVVASLVGFYSGRWTAPIKTVTDKTVVDRNYDAQFTALQTQLRELSKQVADYSQKKNVVTIKKTIQLPDGTITAEEHIEDKTETAAHSESTKDTATSSQSQTQTIKETLHYDHDIKIVETLKAPQWLVGAAVGVNVPNLRNGAQGPPSLIPGIPNYLILEVSVERHLFLGLYGGVAASSRGDLLLKLSKAFK